MIAIDRPGAGAGDTEPGAAVSVLHLANCELPSLSTQAASHYWGQLLQCEPGISCPPLSTLYWQQTLLISPSQKLSTGKEELSSFSASCDC